MRKLTALDKTQCTPANYWCGIRGIYLISRGEWSSPELVYKGRYYDYYGILDHLQTSFADVEGSEFNGTFEQFAKSESEYIRFMLSNDWRHYYAK